MIVCVLRQRVSSSREGVGVVVGGGVVFEEGGCGLASAEV